jgi:glutathione S-transferase
MGILNDLQSFGVSIARFGRGLFVLHHPASPPQEPLQLYEAEGCPFSRKVREVLSELDLVYLSYPVARGSRHEAVLRNLGGKAQIPFLLDPNTGRRLYDAEDIITYLHERYGAGRSTSSFLLAPLQTASSVASSYLRRRGMVVQSHSEPPPKTLILYQYEGSPYCRKVREILHELDLPCLMKNVARGSLRRKELIAHGSKMQVPYLIDPNTQIAMYESEDIIRYLRKTYASS